MRTTEGVTSLSSPVLDDHRAGAVEPGERGVGGVQVDAEFERVAASLDKFTESGALGTSRYSRHPRTT
jgi:hypothetical protein